MVCTVVRMTTTPLLQWLDDLDISRAALSRECSSVDPSIQIPAPHISQYSYGRFAPTPAKANVLAQAIWRLSVAADRPGESVCALHLMHPQGIPAGFGGEAACRCGRAPSDSAADAA